MIEIVEFWNGLYGIRKRNWFERIFNMDGIYLSIKNKHNHWVTYFHVIDNQNWYLGTLDVVKERFNEITIKPIVKHGDWELDR